ncbi:MAG: hypothetical protein JW881_06645 [Spirochaetales bacterium]|nr:hypothetical protein [Spirochaetales bacterium]
MNRRYIQKVIWIESILWIVSILLFTIPLYGEDETTGETAPEKQKIFLLPIRNIAENAEFAHLESFIYNVLTINIKKQASLRLYPESGAVTVPPEKHNDLEGLFSMIRGDYSIENCIVCEYYIVRDELHIIINLWDTGSFRIKNSYRKSMPTDLDMLSNIEALSSRVAENIGRVLPMLEREAILQRQVRSRLYDKLDREERLLDTVFSRHNEIQLSLFTGLNFGRTAVSMSSTGFFISPTLQCEYSRFFGDGIHMRIGLDYLAFDIMDIEDPRSEVSVEALLGFHTTSLFSVSIDAGLAFIYDYNSASSALSYRTDIEETVVKPSIERFSISLPIHFGISLYLTSSFFINMRIKYHGLTATFEPLSPDEYNEGTRLWRYYYGFSPWTLLCFSITTQVGIRF